MVASAGIAGVASLLNGALQYAGQNSANSLNAQMFYESQQFQREMQANAQSYNTRMANTAHQREVADLRRAGLNPLLSAGLGGGSSASAASPVLGSPSSPDIKNPVPSVDPLTFASAKNLKTQSDLNLEETKNKPWERRLIKAQEDRTDEETSLTKISQDVKASELVVNSALAKKYQQETLNSIGITDATIKHLMSQSNYYNNSATNLKQQHDINIPAQQYGKSKYGKGFEYVKQTMNGLQLPSLNFGFHGDIPAPHKKLTPIGFR